MISNANNQLPGDNFTKTADLPFEKVIRVGSLPGYPNRLYLANMYDGHPQQNTDRDPMFGPSIYLKIEYRFKNKGMELSITGVIGPTRDGNAIGGCGQIEMEFQHRNPKQNDARTHDPISPDSIRFAPGWNRQRWQTLLAIWNRWHNNGLNAGCIHQRRLGWDKEPIDPNRPTTDYDRFVPNSRSYSWNLKGWVHEPIGYLMKDCPVCGYSYGSAWIHENVPESVLVWLRNLPDTDREPTWV